MIKSLRIENFALIDSVNIQFDGGFTVITGETGSGKTTIVRHLLKQEKFNLEFSISATSRDPRDFEKK